VLLFSFPDVGEFRRSRAKVALQQFGSRQT